MANLFNLLANTGNKITDAKNALFNRLVGQDMSENLPQLDVVQFGNDGNMDAGSALQIQNRIQPLTPRERLFGRELEQNVQTINPENNSVEMSTIRDFRPGLLNDIASGYNENRNNPIAMSNFGQNTLENGRKKGFAYRLGEGLGSLARIGESPLGRSLLVGGLVGATGGSGLEALTYGAQTGMLNQGNRMADKLYRDDLERQGIDVSGVRGYINKDVYSNMLQAKQLQDNAEWRKAYFDAQQANLKEQQEWRKQQAEMQRAENAANRAFNYYSANLSHQDRIAALEKELGGKPLSDSQVEKINEIDNAIDDVNRIITTYSDPKYSSYFGLSGYAKRNPVTGAFDPIATEMRQDIDLMRKTVAKAKEGGRLTDQDQRYYEKALMNPNLTQADFIKLAKKFQASQQSQRNTRLNNYAKQGKNVSNFLTDENNASNSQILTGSDTVRVKNPDGKIGTIPRANLQKALQQGYEEI